MLFIAHGLDAVAQLQQFALRLASENAVADWYVDAPSSGAFGAVRTVRAIAQRIGEVQPDKVVILGPTLAYPATVAARLRRVPVMYIEDFSFPDRPSPEAQRLVRLKHVELFTQHSRWADERWQYAGTAFDSFRALASRTIPPVRRLTVLPPTDDTTMFEALASRLQAIAPLHTEIRWLTNVTDEGVEAELLACDAVIGQTSIYGALLSLKAGQLPLLIPTETPNENQTDTSFWLQTKGLCVAVAVSELTWNDIAIAGSWAIH